jgi:hypothetical protein
MSALHRGSQRLEHFQHLLDVARSVKYRQTAFDIEMSVIHALLAISSMSQARRAATHKASYSFPNPQVATLTQ